MAQKRYTVLDILRGLSVIAMVIFHLLWDLVYVYDIQVLGFAEDDMSRLVFQRCIRWSFMLLSGFCFRLGRRHLKRGLTVLGGGVIITLVTMVVMPAFPIHHGVLTFLGAAMLISILPDKLLCKVPGWVGLGVSVALFVLTRQVPEGVLGVGRFSVELPWQWYSNYFTAFLGLPSPLFSSSDYVPLIPWIFVFYMGYFGYGIFKKYGWLRHLSCVRCKPLEWVGTHALLIYMLHQPVVYGILYVVFYFIRK